MSEPEAAKMFLLPPAPDKCQTCASSHEPHMPHNAQSIFYQVKFQMENNRGANWLDAMEHCDETMKAIWIAELIAAGVDVHGGKVNPS